MKSLYAKVKYEPTMDVLPAIYRRVILSSIRLIEDVVENAVSVSAAELAAVFIEGSLDLRENP